MILQRSFPALHSLSSKYNLNRVRYLGSSITKLSSPETKACVSKPRRIFSGIQPTGMIHLGNYLGAIVQWKKLQDDNEDVILELADLHSITLPQDPKTLSKNILEMTATLLACGINPDKVLLFQQSMVSTHSEISWLLGCICTMARLNHLPTFKEKSASLKDIPLGLYIYPVLQAADILAYKATHVPVGEDQFQHIQLTQDLAKMFNNRYGYCFPIPHAIVTDNDTSRLKSLRQPLKKMSKSDPDPKSRICLLDKPEDIAMKLKKAVTDFISEVTYDPENRPGVSNLLSIHSFLSNKTIDEICRESQGLNTGQYKTSVADAIIAHIQPIQKEYYSLLSDEKYLFQVLRNGAETAYEISHATLKEMKQKLGLEVLLELSKVKAAMQ
ncbi:hypothetical protein HHI36_004131 [Cryptolaemus montrouzieri]|uniref:Tryptophan--tRNA ligase, mitochondrial n=1 Tax=Cryptolaemus montrouzieri TaxID=559131 RepID=A0ABD2NQK7_9CUCU